MVGREKADMSDTLHLRDVAMATTLAFCIRGAHWRHLTNTTEPSMCGGVMPNYFDHLLLTLKCTSAFL